MRVKGFVALIALLIAGCSAAPDEIKGPADGMTPAEATAEYLSESKTLTLAPGWNWPADPAFDTTGPDGKPMFYQRDYGKTRAGWYWYCSWGHTYLAADTTARADIWTQLIKVRDTSFYKVAMLPRDQVTFDDVLTKAETGDLTDLTEFIANACPDATQ
jgi:hypothetical protein